MQTSVGTRDGCAGLHIAIAAGGIDRDAAGAGRTAIKVRYVYETVYVDCDPVRIAKAGAPSGDRSARPDVALASRPEDSHAVGIAESLSEGLRHSLNRPAIVGHVNVAVRDPARLRSGR
jgi:hypothetical protein